jgi:alkaline phosphatase D
MHLHRAVSWGQLVEFYMLDTRQYRSDQACGDGVRVDCAERLDARRTMLGASQEEWLLARASRSRARWDVLGQQVFMGKLDRGDDQGEAYSMDQWSGYAAARDRLLQGLTATPRNLVVLTGDIPTHYADDLTWDYVRPDSRIIGSELVGTSIASGGDGIEQAPLAGRLLRRNPHLRFINGRRGYVTCAVSPTEWRAHFRVVPYVARPGAPLETRASFVIEAGKQGLQRD